jgi:hypothetical protein
MLHRAEKEPLVAPAGCVIPKSEHCYSAYWRFAYDVANAIGAREIDCRRT